MNIRSTVALILAAAVVLSLLVVAPIALALAGRLDPDTLFGLASLLLSWPIAALILGLLFMTRFHSSIDTFLRNIALMRLPGGFELQSQSQPNAPAEPPAEDSSAPLSEDAEAQADDLRSKIGEVETLSQAEKDLLSQQYEMALTNASYWKFAYLNLFFIPQTKQVLQWFSQSPAQTRVTYSALWAPFIRAEQQRTIILNVLLQYGLLEEQQGLIRITPEGYAFLQFIGAIPFPPQPPQQQSA